MFIYFVKKLFRDGFFFTCLNNRKLTVAGRAAGTVEVLPGHGATGLREPRPPRGCRPQPGLEEG